MNTKKLVLIEYDENGNEVDSNVIMENDELVNAINSGGQRIIPDRLFLDKKDRDLFTAEQWKIIEQLQGSSIVQIWADGRNKYGRLIGEQVFIKANFNKELENVWHQFFKEPQGVQDFISKLLTNWTWHVLLSYEFSFGCSLKEQIDWVNHTQGIYYAVDNQGNRVWDFVDEKPTLKQAKYQRKKGRRIVFLNFKDWKEYIVNESELM